MYIAHTKDGKHFVSEEDAQSLEDHLTNVSNYAYGFANVFGAGEAAKTIGLLHDYGKYRNDFQQKIRLGAEGKKIKAPHAMSGAKLLNESKDLMTKLYGLIIASHHTGMYDSGNSAGYTDNTYFSKVSEYKADIISGVNIAHLVPAQIKHKLFQPAKGKKQISFAIATYLKMLFSALVDADYTDTEEFCTGIIREPETYQMDQIFEAMVKKLPANDGREINVIREKILNDCLSCADQPQGLFTLTVPTGGGKTISSFVFALKHAIAHKLSRIIYVIPYTSIIEQNARVIAELIGSDYVLEHHSNILHESEDFRIRWATENWDIPVVVTTNVQFFESFFSNKPSANRKLHNIANSVIIFDEAQMLPREYLSPSLYAVCELVINYNTTAVLCSATQPSIQNYVYENMRMTEIAGKPLELAEKLKRVTYLNIGQKTDEEVITLLLQQKSGLTIVNSRKHAYALFNILKNHVNTLDTATLCLSTLIPPRERRKKIDLIRKKLEKDEKVFVISTQLIEAGVDVDFPAVFRSIAGIDSIIQAGGRANREGKLKQGQVYVFEPISEDGKIPRSLQNTAGIGKELISSMGEKAFELEGIARYFDILYSTTADNGLLDEKKILGEFEFESGKFNFKTVSDKFKIIDDNTTNIIIPLDENAINMTALLRQNAFNKTTIRELSQYCVSIYSGEFTKLQNDGVIENLNGFFALNNMNYYKEETGLDIFSNSNKNAESYFL